MTGGHVPAFFLSGGNQLDELLRSLEGFQYGPIREMSVSGTSLVSVSSPPSVGVQKYRNGAYTCVFGSP